MNFLQIKKKSFYLIIFSPLPSTRPYQVEHRQLEIDETFDPSNPGQKLEIVEYIYDEDGKLVRIFYSNRKVVSLSCTNLFG